MKSKIYILLIISVFTIISASAQNSSQKKDPAGKWKFEAPYAPVEYSSGGVVPLTLLKEIKETVK